MNKKSLVIGAVALIAVLVVIIVYLSLDEKKEPGENKTGFKTEGTKGYPGAPDPAADLEKLDQIRNLWPDIFQKKPDTEAVKKEWSDFARRYPNNFYLPPDFRPPMSEEERKEHQKELNTFTHVEATIASLRSKSKFVAPGTPPPKVLETDYSPEEQKVYFNYRIKELQSRVELLDFALEKKGLDNDQVARAKKEREEWQEQLKQLQGYVKEIKKEKE